jgi:RHS repeat-associated protein
VTATYLRSLNIDEAFGVLRQDGTYFYLFDGLSSTLALTNQAGASAVQYTYEPFGQTQSSNPAFQNPFQFTGRENDGTGLYYYRARFHSPSLHRFVSQDPMGLAGGVNVYAYVLNNPILFTDPFGLEIFCVFGQSTGRLLCTCDGKVIVDVKTYSGDGPGKNDPFYEGVPDRGPIPQGVWEIRRMVRRSPGGTLKNPLPLRPRQGNDVYNTKRDPDSFYIHGPNPNDPMNSSKGCVILDLPDRRKIDDCSDPKILIVTP